MTNPLTGVIADDFTGATDVAALLARGDGAVRLLTGDPPPDAGSGAAAIVLARKIRTVPPEEAVAAARAALDALRAAGATRFYWKYCSTFDSTPRGNIGPVAEALMADLGAGWTVHCPAFPQNGRVVRDGRLFVGGVPLAESPMKDHPLTPMRYSDLVRLLSPQIRGRAARLPAGGAPRAQAEALAADGVSHLLPDAETDADLARLGTAFADRPLLCGGSAFAAAAWGGAPSGGAMRPAVPEAVRAGPVLILSGSCSAATRAQVAAFRATGAPVIDLDPLTLDDDRLLSCLGDVLARLGAAPVLVTSTAAPQRLAQIQAALGAGTASARLEEAMGRMARAARAAGTSRFVVAGGETSGAVTAALGAGRLDIVHEIAPGVPWCLAEDAAGPFALALKSGNFGGPGFFLEALDLL